MGYIGTKPTDAPLTSSQLDDGIVTAAKLATDSVETAKVKDVNVTAGKLATDSVETAKVKDLNVTAGKLAATQDLSTKTITLPASVAGLGTGITNAQLAGSIDVTSKITGTVPTSNLGSGSASASTYLAGNQTYQTIEEYNDAEIRSDVMSLALKQATQENMTKHNLPNAAIVVFQADADFNLAGSTDISRNASNYIESTTTASVTNAVDWSYKRTGNATTVSNATWTTGLSDNDRATAGDDSSFYTIGLAHTRCFDLSQDFNFQTFFVDGSGVRTSFDYPNLNCIVSTDTTYAGTEQTAIWFDAGSNDNTGTTNDWIPSTAQAFTSAVNSALSYSGYNLTNVTNAAGGTTTVDMASTSRDFNMYFNDGTNYHGLSVIYDASASTMTMGAVTDTSRTVSTVAKCIANNVPSTGTCFIGAGNSQLIASKWHSLTYASGTGYSTYDSSSTVPSATGTALGTTNVPAAAVTQVSGVILVKDAFGTNVMGTDVKVYFTADNSNWTEASSYTSSGTFSTGISQITLGKTTVTSGSDVRWKIVYANQVASTLIAYVYGMGTNY